MSPIRKAWETFAASNKYVLYLYVIVALVVSLQQWLSNPTNLGDISYPDYNNYLIFSQSFHHLINGKDLYLPYPQEHWDLFKYSPTFALLFAPFAVLPDLAGIIAWTMLNTLILLWGIQRLPVFTQQMKVKILLFAAIELITSLQNMQSNALLAGLIILAFCFLEEGKYLAGIFCITVTVFIKIFGILAFGLLLFYPNKPKLILYSTATFLILLLLPLVIVPVQQLLNLYDSWWTVLSADRTAEYGFSVMGWLRSWFGLEINKDVAVLIGLILLGLPLLWFKRYASYSYRVLLLSGLLIWLVIFNHMAESPTFIIAACGAALWFFMRPRGTFDLALIILFFLFSGLSPTDFFPSIIRKEWFEPFVVKVVPAILVWFRITWEVLAFQQTQQLLPEDSK